MTSRAIDLIEVLGSPFCQSATSKYTDKDLLILYEPAFKNRVGLLLLETYRRDGWDSELEEKYQMLKAREQKTLEVIVRLAEKLNQFDQQNYVIFKSIKPYPATPNDTDVLYLGDKEKYQQMVDYLLQNGYEFHEWAPQQKTVYDVQGRDFIGKGKKGGTYYIDLYEEISTDYYAYLDRNVLRPFIVKRSIDGIAVNLLRPEPELAIILFHNVFPERTFQLEHFYLPLHYLKDSGFDLSLFLDFVTVNRLQVAIRTNFTFIAYLHQKYFGQVPEPVQTILDQLGTNHSELQRFINADLKLPYLFSPKTFWITFFRKSQEWYSFRSLIVQSIKMLNPVFFWDVVKSLKARLGEEGVYHVE